MKVMHSSRQFLFFFGLRYDFLPYSYHMEHTQTHTEQNMNTNQMLHPKML